MTFRHVEHLEVFVEVVRAGSFSTVARQRGLAASSVARQIDALEQDLQVPLFIRSTRSLTPTRAGEVLFQRAVSILEDLTDARSEVRSFEHEVQGVLQVGCLPTFGRRYVIPCIARLVRRHPALSIDLNLTENLIAPTVERQDVAIRFGEQPDSNLIATRIGSQRYVICASPEYLRLAPLPRTVTELRRHRLIDKRHRASPFGWREVLGTQATATTAYVLEADDFEAQRLAALAGAGIARLPDWVVGHDVRQGALSELTIDGIKGQTATGIYLMRALPKPSAKLRVFMQELVSEIGSPNVWQCGSGSGNP